MYGQTVRREEPFVGAGTNALAELQRLLGIGPGGGGATNPVLQMLGIGTPGGAGTIDPTKFQGSPGYQYALQQGTNTVTNAASRSGGLGGNALRALQGTGQGLANQNFNQYIGNVGNSWQTLLANLAQLSGSGQSAAANLGGLGAGAANQISGNILGAGNAAASGIIGGTNALTGGINGGLQGLMTMLQNKDFQGLFKPGANDGSGTPSYISLDPSGQSIAPGYGVG